MLVKLFWDPANSVVTIDTPNKSIGVYVNSSESLTASSESSIVDFRSYEGFWTDNNSIPNDDRDTNGVWNNMALKFIDGTHAMIDIQRILLRRGVPYSSGDRTFITTVTFNEEGTTNFTIPENEGSGFIKLNNDHVSVTLDNRADNPDVFFGTVDLTIKKPIPDDILKYQFAGK